MRSERHYAHLVVGGGVAGGRAVEALSKRADSVALVSAEPWRPYARPPLSKQALVDGAPIDELCLREPSWYAAQRVDLLLGDRVVTLDRDRCALTLASGTRLGFDNLLLAPGVEPVRLTVPGADLPGVHYLRTYEDAVALRRALDMRGRPSRVVIVGGGFIGCEIASSLVRLDARVAIVEVADQLMVHALGDEVGALLTTRHKTAGVDVRVGARVERLRGGTAVEAVCLDDGDELVCDLVVVGIGARPRLDWLAEAGLDLDDGIVVDEHCRTSRPHVYGAGDATAAYSPRLGRRRRLEHESNAQSQGVVAARNMLGGLSIHDPIPYCWSAQYDLDIWTLGEPGQGSEVSVVRGGQDGQVLATYSRDGRTVGVVGINRPDQLAPARQLLIEVSSTPAG